MVSDRQMKDLTRILQRAIRLLRDARDSALTAYNALDKVRDIPQTTINTQAEQTRVDQVLTGLEETMRTLAEKEVEARTGQPPSPEQREQIKQDQMKARLRR
ncbi:hypothetical protein LCGC14_1368880 [marine sediment metagenome]|uniref:Uncharacterized protein n=1 Tax=marine sediment metagenome TaxID=412755 RepID=A0A0F9N7W6_9ZZZZ